MAILRDINIDEPHELSPARIDDLKDALGVSLQGVYEDSASGTAEIVTSDENGALTIKNGESEAGATLLEIEDAGANLVASIDDAGTIKAINIKPTNGIVGADGQVLSYSSADGSIKWVNNSGSVTGTPYKLPKFNAGGSLADSHLMNDDFNNIFSSDATIVNPGFGQSSDNFAFKYNSVEGQNNATIGYGNDIQGNYVNILGNQNDVVGGSGETIVGYDSTSTNTSDSTMVGYFNNITGGDTDIVIGSYNKILDGTGGSHRNIFGENNDIPAGFTNCNFFGKYFRGTWTPEQQGYGNYFGGQDARSMFMGQWADRNGFYPNSSDGQTYVLGSVEASDTCVDAGQGGELIWRRVTPEAPDDGKVYGRQSEAWVEVIGGGGVGTLQQVTDLGATTTNNITAPDFISSGGMGSLVTQINTNISDISTNQSDIATNTGDIATNTTNITTNTNAIATNVSGIITLNNDLTTLTGRVSTNETDIASNTSAIAGIDTSGIAVNAAAIASNDVDIAALDVRVTDNEAQILALDSAGFITDAPSDGKQYARQDALWTEVTGGSIELTPNTALANNTGTTQDGFAVDIATDLAAAVAGDLVYADAVKTVTDAIDTRVTTNESDIAANTAAIDSIEPSRIEVTQVAHGFAVLESVYRDELGVWQLAQADHIDTLGTHIIAEVIDVDNFTATNTGVVDAPSHGLIVDDYYYTSDVTAGAMTDIEPSIYSNPMFKVINSDSVEAFPWRPSQTGGAVGQTGPTGPQGPAGFSNVLVVDSLPGTPDAFTLYVIT